MTCPTAYSPCVHLKNNAASFDLHSEMFSFDKQWIYYIEKVGKNGKKLCSIRDQ